MNQMPNVEQQILVFAEQSADSAKFSCVESIVFDDASSNQLNQNFIAILDYMHMRGSMFICMYINIAFVSLTMQNCDQQSTQP